MQYLLLIILPFLSLAQNFGNNNNVPGLNNADIENPLKVVSVSSAPEGTTTNSRFPVTIQLTIPEGFHAYEDKFKISCLSPEGSQISEIILRPAQDFIDFGGKTHKGLVESGSLEFFVELPGKIDMKIKSLKFDMDYVACTKKFCLPRKQVSFEVPVHMKSMSTDSTAYIEEKIESNLFLAFLIIFAFGFLTSLTPCVYPLIPITLAVIGARTAQSKKSHAFSLSVVYVLGIAMTYSLLGVVAAQTGALFGQALSYPPVIIFFAFLFFMMGLSMFGLFEIRLPHFLTHKLTNKKKQSTGYIGAFLSGLMAGIIASPCVGPVLVGILAYIAKTQDVVLGFSLLFTFAMGMGVLFIVIGTSSSLLKKLPRSGGWMNVIKYAMGVAMIGLGIFYLKPLLGNHATTTATAATSVPLRNGWQLYSEELLRKAQAEGKPVMIDFFADWCGACVELDEKSFSQGKFITASKDFMLLKVDATENSPGLPALQKTYDVFGLPTVVFVSKSGKMIKDLTLTGYEEADKIIERMNQAKQRP